MTLEDKIIKEFKERFRKGDYVPLTNVVEDIEQFIIQALQQQRDEICEEIEIEIRKARKNIWNKEITLNNLDEVIKIIKDKT